MVTRSPRPRRSQRDSYSWPASCFTDAQPLPDQPRKRRFKVRSRSGLRLW